MPSTSHTGYSSAGDVWRGFSQTEFRAQLQSCLSGPAEAPAPTVLCDELIERLQRQLSALTAGTMTGTASMQEPLRGDGMSEDDNEDGCAHLRTLTHGAAPAADPSEISSATPDQAADGSSNGGEAMQALVAALMRRSQTLVYPHAFSSGNGSLPALEEWIPTDSLERLPPLQPVPSLDSGSGLENELPQNAYDGLHDYGGYRIRSATNVQPFYHNMADPRSQQAAAEIQLSSPSAESVAELGMYDMEHTEAAQPIVEPVTVALPHAEDPSQAGSWDALLPAAPLSLPHFNARSQAQSWDAQLQIAAAAATEREAPSNPW